MFEKTSRKYLKYQKKCYLCTVKSVVDASCFSSDKRLEMRIFDGLSGWVRLAKQTVDSYRYGRAFVGIWAFTASARHCSRTIKKEIERKINYKPSERT